MITGAWTSVLALVRNGLVFLLACGVIAGTAMSVYLLFLAAASLRRTRRPAPQGDPNTRFAILIPAHDEELVIGRLLDSVNRLAYPRELYEVHVVADHCSDQTATIARGRGAVVHERRDPALRGKSRSLNLLAQYLLGASTGLLTDAFVFLDADSSVSTNFLSVMDRHIRAGHRIVQGRVQVEDPGDDRTGQLRALAYEFISHVRPLGREALGLSVGLRGNGICIVREYVELFPWDPESLTEDYELHGRMLAAGLQVRFAPDAVVRTQLPTSRAVARTQSQRWERGRLDAMRRHVPALIEHGLRARSWASIDGAIELLVPPFSILIALMGALLGLSVLSGVVPLVVLSAVGFAALCVYTQRGLALASTYYPHIYRALLFVPAFVLWRLWLYLGVVARRGRVQWTRTLRTPNQ
jgi:1,2-diacylglycerol 3-beta-glucosyltransferase